MRYSVTNVTNCYNTKFRWGVMCYSVRNVTNYHLIVKLTLPDFDCRVKHRNRIKIMVSILL